MPSAGSTGLSAGSAGDPPPFPKLSDGGGPIVRTLSDVQN